MNPRPHTHSPQAEPDETAGDLLVSVIVATFNSRAAVLEKPDSITAQRHAALELLVRDDASSDGTTDVVDDWLARNGDRFRRAELLRSPLNLAVCHNVDGAYAIAGRWLKPVSNAQVEAHWKVWVVEAFMRIGERCSDITGKINCIAALNRASRIAATLRRLAGRSLRPPSNGSEP